MGKKSRNKNRRKSKPTVTKRKANNDATPSTPSSQEFPNDDCVAVSSSASLVSTATSATESAVDDITETEPSLCLIETATPSTAKSKPYISLNMNLSDDIESFIAKLDAKQSRIREIQIALQEKLQSLHDMKTSCTQQSVNC